ncbi:inositol phosphophingolipids phospholipase C [Gautieria morchelliformis]|nr:inositol phosphophingolipids phospholipase C [Gautieria morchelliformis]
MSSVRVLSFNCWGLKYVAKNRKERIRAIAEELAASSYDIIGLQELWVYADYEHVRAKLSDKLRFSKFFRSGAVGAGLALFSRFPILTTSIHPYSLSGAPLDVAGGDWFAAKSAASIVIYHPVLGEVEVFNTHMYARGGEEGPEEHRAHRLVHAWELAKLIRRSAQLRYVIALGDFNSVPTSLPMTILREHACLTDAWVQSHDSLPRPASVLSPQQALSDYGVTADSPLNFYSAGKPLSIATRKQHGKRLDYIFFRHSLKRQSNKGAQSILTATESKVVLTGNVPGYNFSLSDHFGVEATLTISQMEVGDTFHDVESGLLNSMIPPSSESCLSSAALGTTLQALVARYRTSRSQSHFQLIIFVACVCILLAVIVSSVWLPRAWINPIFLFFTVFVSWLGTTMLYSGFIFGHWEVNALTNVIEELEFLRQRGLGASSAVLDST